MSLLATIVSQTFLNRFEGYGQISLELTKTFSREGIEENFLNIIKDI
jgi:hypothetical protein